MHYYRHFGLSNPPFEMTGKPNSLYMSKAHIEGLAALEWGLLHEPGQFTLLMGEAGTGKTTLINVLLSRHFQCIANADGRALYSIRTSDLARITYVMNPKLGFEEMLRVVLEQLGYPPTSSMTKLELLRQFESLFGQLRPRERIAIIVDEAQALSDETLEELRLFSNYGQYGKGHLEILLVGQPELLTRLMEPSLRQFHQRIGARAMLNPLQREEAFEYIEHKLRENGGSTKEIFSQRALKLLVDHSHGIPRQLNLLCNNALIRTYGSGLRWVTIEVAREAVREYENLAKTEEKFRKPIGRRALHSIMARPAIPIVGVGLIALVGFCARGVRMRDIALIASGIANTNVRQYREAHDTSQNALPLIKASGDSVADNPLGGSPANGPLTLSASHIANDEAAKHGPRDAIAIPRLGPTQASGAPSFVSAPISNATQADTAVAPKSLKTSLQASPSPTIIEEPGGSEAGAEPAHHSLNRREASGQTTQLAHSI